MTNPPAVVTEVTLDTHQIQFIMDLMMGCPMGFTKDHAYQNQIDDSSLYNHLDNCLHDALAELSEGL